MITDDGHQIRKSVFTLAIAAGFKIWSKQLLELPRDGRFGVLVYLPKERYPVLISRMGSTNEMTDWEIYTINNNPSVQGFFYDNKIAFLQLHPWPSVIGVEEFSYEFMLRFPYLLKYRHKEDEQYE